MISLLNIDKYRGFDILISHKFKFIYCLVLKNGSSSILNSILNYEYGDNYNNEHSIIWNYIKQHDDLYLHIMNKIFISFTNPLDLKMFLDEYTNYRKFIVLNDPNKRFISWLNFFPQLFFNKIDLLFGLDLYHYINDTINKPFIINYYNDNLSSDNYVEYHCLPLEIFLDFFTKAIDNLEIILLENLKTFCKEQLGFDLIINNRTKNKIITELPPNGTL